MHRVLLLSLLAFPVRVQDDLRIKELIQNLDDDSFEARDKAEKELVALGSSAIPYLKAVIAEADQQKEKAELKIRATSALRGIEFAAKAKLYYYEPKFVTLDAANAELGSVLSDLEKKTGVRLDAGAINPKAKITLHAENRPLFQVLDELCRGQEERSYEYREEGVRFSRARFVDCPSSYIGPFRIRIVKLQHERTTDFKSSNGEAHLLLEADWQKYLKPSRQVDLEIRAATDDKGGALEILKSVPGTEENEVALWLNARVRRGGGGDTEQQNLQPFTLKGLSRGAVRLSLQGTAKFRFPLEKADILFDKPATAEPKQEGDVTISLKNQGDARIWRLTLTHTQGRPPVIPEDLDGAVDKESFVALDEAGKEHPATLHESRDKEARVVIRGAEMPEGTPLAIYQVVFPTLEGRMPKGIRFKFVSQVFVKSVPFVISDIPLP
ncbi:MAG: hypothetical protein HY255_05955 [Betaproteobacteria bacterium]|nr:hypothetical protein [Betaproteobacteria bacterium]